ncbi:hypothetical protein MASR1M59_22010 [Melaminivora sp.]
MQQVADPAHRLERIGTRARLLRVMGLHVDDVAVHGRAPSSDAGQGGMRAGARQRLGRGWGGAPGFLPLRLSGLGRRGLLLLTRLGLAKRFFFDAAGAFAALQLGDHLGR